MIEIEERGFIIGASIDLKEKISENRYKVEITDQLAISSAFGPSQGGAGSDSEAYINLTASGENIMSIDQDLEKQTSKEPYFQHLKVLIISEEVVKIPHLFENILDIHIRGAEFRRGIKILIAKGEAKEVIDIKPMDEKLPAIYINKILDRVDKQTDVIKHLTIGDIQEANLKDASYILPIIYTKEKNRVSFEGAAVMHGHEKRMVGKLTDEESFGLNLLTGKDKTGTFDFDYKDEIISMELSEIKNSIKVDPSNIDNIKVNVSLELSGTIKEVFGRVYPKEQRDINEMEEAAKKKLKSLANDVIRKSQEELNADIFGINDILFTRHYDTWQKVKDNWDHGENYFSQVTFTIEPEILIEHTGTSEKTFGGSD